MKLPNAINAYVSPVKLTGYLLSETHPVGSAKAKFYRKIGFNEENINNLINLFIKIAQDNEIKESRKSSYGTNYVIDGIIESPKNGSVRISTVWFIANGESKPRFVTAYPI